MIRAISRALDWFAWHVLAGLPTGYRKPWRLLLAYGPYMWGMALYNRTWLKEWR
jgi:hypothetical protein